jgi:hypothetical protein
VVTPTTLTITYTGGSGSPQTYSIPKVSGVAIDFTQAVKNLLIAGGFWFVSATGVNTFVPYAQITSITAQ